MGLVFAITAVMVLLAAAWIIQLVVWVARPGANEEEEFRQHIIRQYRDKEAKQ